MDLITYFMMDDMMTLFSSQKHFLIPDRPDHLQAREFTNHRFEIWMGSFHPSQYISWWYNLKQAATDLIISCTQFDLSVDSGFVFSLREACHPCIPNTRPPKTFFIGSSRLVDSRYHMHDLLASAKRWVPYFGFWGWQINKNIPTAFHK